MLAHAESGVRIWCEFLLLILLTGEVWLFHLPWFPWDVMGCFCWFSFFICDTSSYPHRPKIEMALLSGFICFIRHLLCLLIPFLLFISDVIFLHGLFHCLSIWYHMRELRHLSSFLFIYIASCPFFWPLSAPSSLLSTIYLFPCVLYIFLTILCDLFICSSIFIHHIWGVYILTFNLYIFDCCWLWFHTL